MHPPIPERTPTDYALARAARVAAAMRARTADRLTARAIRHAIDPAAFELAR